MSAVQMIDMCVRYIARRHHMLTDEHVALLDEIWELYEPSELDLAQEIPLPPSPPPERQHVHFEGAEQPKPQQAEWPCDRCLNEEIWECGQCVVRSQEQEQEDSEWQEKRRATLADFATLQKEADYQAQLQEEAEEQAEYYREQREEAALWRQVPQGEPVSASMKHKEVCGCDTCEWQDRRRAEEEYKEALQDRLDTLEAEKEEEQEEQEEQQYRVPRCSDYLYSRAYECGTCDIEPWDYDCGKACGASPQPVRAPVAEPVIDLTCDRASCSYGCDSKHEPVGSAYPLPPIESCLYGCSFSCGANPGEDCIAQFDEQGEQLPALVRTVVETAIEDDDDDMPALVSFGTCHNPEEETEIVEPTQQGAPTKSPKAKPIFPYNHPRWPSPRAKALVQWMIRRGRTSKSAIEYALGEPVKGLTHDMCMRYLAKFYRLSHEDLLATTIYSLHNPDMHTPYYYRCTCSFCKGGYRY
jgi:hypothetical protein